MTTALTSHFTASHGRPFEVHWKSEANSRETWQWNNAHNPEPFTPLFEWVMQQAPGRLRAYAEAGVDAPHLFRGFEIQNGFQYVRQSPLRGEELAQFGAKSRALAGKYGGACNVFEGFALPRIQAACSELQNAPVSTPIETLAEKFNYAFHMTHVAGPAVFGPLQARLMAVLANRFPAAEAMLLCQEIGQGAESATIESDRALGRMAELAIANGAITAAINGPREEAMAAIAAAPGAEQFRTEFASYVAAHRWRAESWGIEDPTVGERPEIVLDMINQSMHSPRDHDALRAAALAVRKTAIARMEAKLAGDAEALAFLHSCAAELERYVFVREGRAHWQLTAGGSLRGALLRKGEAMVSAGVIDDAADILYLLPEEIDPFFTGGRESDDLRSLVEPRRALREERKTFTPPYEISGAPSAPTAGETRSTSGLLIRGAPGSRGTVTATARVITELADAEELEPGEVLVCVMTSPPWTPLFGIASGIVTDSGAALSHSAIAAREYGIPAVVGTNDATSRIKTGDVITVDGDAGTVNIDSRAG